MDINVNVNIPTDNLCDDGYVYRAVREYIIALDNHLITIPQFVQMVLGARRNSIHYLYLACTHPNTPDESLAGLIEEIVYYTMSSWDIRNLLSTAAGNYNQLPEFADFINRELLEKCMEGSPVHLFAAKIMAPPYVWSPSLKPNMIFWNMEEILDAARTTIGPGWWPILDRLLNEIAATEPNAGSIHPADVTVKEKYGAMRVYLPFDNIVNVKYVSNLLHEAEEESMRTCEECGAPGHLREQRNGWVRTLCDRCSIE